MKKFVGLVILDGFGIAKPGPTNSVSLAKKPTLDYLMKEYPNKTLNASGTYVGLPEGQMGNSEVGHLNLGAGRVVWQSLSRIHQAVKTGEFYENKAFLNAIKHAKKHNSKLHIFGLAGDGGVHSHSNHIIALYELAKRNGLENKTYYHAFLDGRDTPPTSGLGFLKDIAKSGLNIATVSGRYYAMDRDNNWDRLQLAIDNLTLGTGKKYSSFAEGVQASYDAGVTDEFLVPFLVDENGLIGDNDAIIFANFRPDRAIRISTAFSNPTAVKEYYSPGKAQFDASNIPSNIFYVSMMHYADTVKGEIAYGLQDLVNLYGDIVSEAGLTQLRAAETEKYAHVTFFFDGGYDKELKGAKRLLIPSPKVATYDLKPEMSAYELTDAVIKELQENKYDTMILNYANPDMVGHTGSIEAATKAVEVVDECLGKIYEQVNKMNGTLIIIADHGNAEVMRTEAGEPHTAHTSNIVPIIITDKNVKIRDNGALCDIAPTMLKMLELKQPKEMTGESLI